MDGKVTGVKTRLPFFAEPRLALTDGCLDLGLDLKISAFETSVALIAKIHTHT